MSFSSIGAGTLFVNGQEVGTIKGDVHCQPTAMELEIPEFKPINLNIPIKLEVQAGWVNWTQVRKLLGLPPECTDVQCKLSYIYTPPAVPIRPPGRTTRCKDCRVRSLRQLDRLAAADLWRRKRGWR